MRAYYIATDLERHKTGYRQRLFEEWKQLEPTINVTEQCVCDQVRTILTRNFLSSAELNHIKSEIANQTPSSTIQSQAESDPYPLDESAIIYSDYELEEPNRPQSPTPLAQMLPEIDLTTKQQAEFNLHKAIEEYEGTEPSTRPRIPKIPINRKSNQIIKHINSILPQFLNSSNKFSLEFTQTVVYCAAVATYRTLGIPTPEFTIVPNKIYIDSDPKWKTRIEKRIKDLF